MKKFLLLIIILFSIHKNYAQYKKIIYVDDSYKNVNFKEFDKKLNSNLFDVLVVENDTAIFKKLRFREYFGKFNKEKKLSLDKYLKEKFNINMAKTLLIHYYDSLPDIKKCLKNLKLFIQILAKRSIDI